MSLKLYTAADRRRMNLVTADDILKSTRAAAKLGLQGEQWSAEDRAECAAHLVTLVMGRATLDAETVRTPAHGNLYPARLIGMDFLVKRAGDWRRAREAQIARDAADANERGGMAVHGSTTGDNGDANNLTPWGARIRAVEMLQNAGIIGATMDAPAPMWSLAYGAARGAAGIESREVAEELELTFDTYRAHLSRAAKTLRACGGWDAWLDALLMEGIDWSAPGEYVHERAEDIASRTARANARDAAVSVRTVKPRTIGKRASAGAAWSRARVSPAFRVRTVIDPLPARTHDRLRKASDMRRKRAAAVTPAERRQARLAAGLPVES
jgi:hypothetical protein